MAQSAIHQTIVILDYGSQYSQLIARRVREANVFCRMVSWRTEPDKVLKLNPQGFILSGGPNSVYDASAPELPEYVLASGRPILGICYGMQLLASRLGGKVAGASEHEYGLATLNLTNDGGPLFTGWKSLLDEVTVDPVQADPGQVWMSHADRVDRLPPGFEAIASTENAPYAAAADIDRGIYTVQFHPEVAHTIQGRTLIENFVLGICGCTGDWTPAGFIEEQVQQLRERIGKGQVILGLSGGVDSAVTASLVQRAIGEQLTCIFIDHGFLRAGESQQIIETVQSQQGMNLVAVNAVEEFLGDLEGVTDPEQKRVLIGNRFIRVFEREAQRLGKVDFLAQGTIYPDVIESASHAEAESRTIKTHHNVGGLPEDMALDLVEPLRLLFKDEVRIVGRELGLPASIVDRQPFPGPGLAIRCLGPVTWERLERLREADAIFRAELERDSLLPGMTQQAFAVLLPVKSVGVMGDNRSYEEVLALRAVSSEDFMTADWTRLPYEVLARTSRRIVNEVPGIGRVVFDITSKPPGTIEWE